MSDAEATDVVFYDGTCGLCHGWVRFLLRRDRKGRRFRYAPLQGETWTARLSAERRRELPDSIVVLTRVGELLVESAGILYLLRRVGGRWILVAALLCIVPRPLRDLKYVCWQRLEIDPGQRSETDPPRSGSSVAKFSCLWTSRVSTDSSSSGGWGSCGSLWETP